jgi:hypothetical protein
MHSKIIVLLLLLSFNIQAATNNSACSIFDNVESENRPQASDPTKSEERFREIITQVSNLYVQTIKDLGGELSIETDWASDTNNAYAQREESKWIIKLFGGYYRNYSMTDDAFAGIVCHELGHHLGGAPFKPTKQGIRWASSEGQADYWASAVCLKKYFETYPKEVQLDNLNTKKQCDEKYQDTSERNICYREALSALSIAKVFNGGGSYYTNFAGSTSTAIASFSQYEHPDAQCRYDTFMAGTLCSPADSNLELERKLLKSENSYNDFLCEETVNGQLTYVNKRPTCWFNPNALYYSKNYSADVKVKPIFKGLQYIEVEVKYMNFFAGDYSIKLTPDDETRKFLMVFRDHYDLKLEKNKYGIYQFSYKFNKKTKGMMRFNLSISFNGKEIITDTVQVRAR